jgi:RNA polymerase sigma factor (sigma-70 family)
MPTQQPESSAIRFGRGFCTTRWTTVLSAASATNPDAEDAWNNLARAYWYPLYAYIRRVGYGPEDAGDLTQAFFASLIEHRVLARLVPGKGRFRSYLLTCLKHFLVDHHRHAKSTIRSSGKPVLSLDLAEGEQRYLFEAEAAPSPEFLYDRSWARSLLEEALARVKSDYDRLGQERLFKELIAHLTQDVDSVPHAQLARRLRSTEAAVRAAMCRLRKRLSEVFIATIAATVPPEDLQDEIRHVQWLLRS